MMKDTLVESHVHIDSDIMPAQGIIFGGYILRRAQEVAFLAVQQLVQDSLEVQEDKEMQDAETTSHCIDMFNMDEVFFNIPIRVGEILHLDARWFSWTSRKALSRSKSMRIQLIALLDRG